tara:strand:+ start:1183 stop:1794 length:612 start_codon:yes stop_codon:yes gene_type:complete
VVPKAQNFEVRTKESDGRTSVFLVKDNGESLDLASYLPEGFNFQAGNRYTCYPEKGVITFPPGELKYRGAALALLHETGHAHFGPPNAHYSLFEKIRSTVQVLSKSVRVSGRREELGELPTQALWPDWLIMKEHDADIATERKAWAFALKQARRIEKENGFQIFADFSNAQDVKNFISYGLLTHSHTHKLDMIMSKLAEIPEV